MTAAHTPTPHGEEPPCPITHRPYFMHIEHPDLGDVPTYGGPFDSYTTPEPDENGHFRSEHYCHDRGDWIEGGHPEGLMLVTEREFNTLSNSNDALAADSAVLAAIRDHADNNPIISEARRWYSRLNKSELLDSTTATRVGVLLCGLDAMSNRYTALKAQNADLSSRLESANKIVRDNAATIERLVRELEEAKATRSEEAFGGALSDELQKSQRDALLAALEKSREFVRLRWRHLSDCPEAGAHPNAVVFDRCNCGLKVALAELDGPLKAAKGAA